MATKKAPAKKKAAAKKAPAKKAAPRKRAAPRVSAKKKAAQETAIHWAVAHGAPIAMLQGWNPNTGKWATASPIGRTLKSIETEGVHLHTASVKHGARWIEDQVAKGREYLADAEVSEDRMLVPIEIRPFVDLALLIDGAEAIAETTVVARAFLEGQSDARIGLQYLGRRFPTRWKDQQDLHATIEHDPREAAVGRLMEDPNTALKLAEFAREAEERAAADTDDDIT
jgi:hypothetical protein